MGYDVDNSLRNLLGISIVPENFQLPTKPNSSLLSKQKKVIEKQTIRIFNKIAANRTSVVTGLNGIIVLWNTIMSPQGTTLNNVTVGGSSALIYAMLFLADKLTDPENEPSLIFRNAYIAAMAADMHPLFHDLFLAKLYETCPWTVPRYLDIDRSRCKSAIEYKLRIGFNTEELEDGKKHLETTESYSTRQQSHVSLFLAYLSVDPSKLVRPSEALRIKSPLYQYLAAAVNAIDTVPDSDSPTSDITSSTSLLSVSASGPTTAATLGPIAFLDGTVVSPAVLTEAPVVTATARCGIAWVWIAKVLNNRHITLMTPLLVKLVLQYAAAAISEMYGEQSMKLWRLISRIQDHWPQQVQIFGVPQTEWLLDVS